MKDDQITQDLALIARNAIAYINKLERQINELKQDAEPVAWKDKIYETLYHQNFGNSIPLYTAPPQRKPLSEDEALDIARTFGAQPWPPGSCVAFARAIERAHNITGDNT